jgi:hypothetical protein
MQAFLVQVELGLQSLAVQVELGLQSLAVQVELGLQSLAVQVELGFARKRRSCTYSSFTNSPYATTMCVNCKVDISSRSIC